MKKVAILTITNSGLNFGNRLQNYALQEAIKSCGVEVETIQSAKSVKCSVLLSAARRKAKLLLKNEKRRQCFKQFDKSYVKYADKVRYENINESEFADRYDAFVAGSDQVWNPNFHFNSDFEFATFADKCKRFSYAASIGVSEIKPEHQKDFIKNIQGMRAISVRESDSIELVEKLCKRQAQIHVDPTMLLSREDYYKIEQMPPQGLPQKYLLVYFLGNVPVKYREKINILADKLGLEVVELSELKGTKYYNIGPQHFLYAINHADYICTDSFHGTVFSILFQKQFSIFIRTDNDVPMNSRIETLVDKFEVRDRLAAQMDVDSAMKPIDYKKIEEILISERKKSQEYLHEISKMW